MLLEAKDIVKSYTEVSEKLVVLNGTSIQVNEGDLIAITGESGSGKSTLMHLLGLLDSPDSGEIFFKDKEIESKRKDVNVFRNKEFGFIFQFHYLLEDFTALENVAVPYFIQTGKKKESHELALELLKKLRLDHRKDHYPNKLSGGEQQRTAIARALINKPAIVFADEPTGNLDPVHSQELMDLIINLNATQNQAFVIVTHDPQIANQCKSHFEMKNGKLEKIR
jgi:lipoprotein-releasing system ATP-binding protein